MRSATKAIHHALASSQLYEHLSPRRPHPAAARAMARPPEVILMTAYAEVPSAVAALKAGACDYLAKPFEPDDLFRVVTRAAERHRLVHRALDLEAALGSSEEGFIGTSGAAQHIRKWIDRVGPMPTPVLITGETGTGKELVARELHRRYGRGEFVAVNCGAIPENLLESELFGVAKGAFTGAQGDRKGLIDLAAGGTLFLDEIGDLPLSLQVKLNRGRGLLLSTSARIRMVKGGFTMELSLCLHPSTKEEEETSMIADLASLDAGLSVQKWLTNDIALSADLDSPLVAYQAEVPSGPREFATE